MKKVVAVFVLSVVLVLNSGMTNVYAAQMPRWENTGFCVVDMVISKDTAKCFGYVEVRKQPVEKVVIKLTLQKYNPRDGFWHHVESWSEEFDGKSDCGSQKKYAVMNGYSYRTIADFEITVDGYTEYISLVSKEEFVE